MRARYLVALAILALALALAGCGGGGGGTTLVTTNITGRAVDIAGNGIDGATVEVDTGAAAPISSATSGGGYYTLPGVPVNADLTLIVHNSGNTYQYGGVRINPPLSGPTTPMDIVVTSYAPSVGSTISILPADSQIWATTNPSYRVVLDSNSSTVYAVWTVTGATGHVVDGEYFMLTPGPVGTTVRLRAMVRLSNGQVVTAERTMTVVPADDDVPPPPPT